MDVMALLSQHIQDLSNAVKATAVRYCDICIGQPIHIKRTKIHGHVHNMGIFLGLPCETEELPSHLNSTVRKVSRSVAIRAAPLGALLTALFMAYGLEEDIARSVASAWNTFSHHVESHFSDDRTFNRSMVTLRMLNHLQDIGKYPGSFSTLKETLHEMRDITAALLHPLVDPERLHVLTLIEDECFGSRALKDREEGVKESHSRDDGPIQRAARAAVDLLGDDLRVVDASEDSLVSACEMLCQVLAFKRSAILIGRAGVGKTLALRAFFHTLTKLVADDETAPRVHRIFPGAIETEQLLGHDGYGSGAIDFANSILGKLFERSLGKPLISIQGPQVGNPAVTPKVARRQSRMVSRESAVSEAGRMMRELIQVSDLIFLDGHLHGEVADTLAPVLSSGQIYPRDGSLVIMDSTVRVVWEASCMPMAPPSLLSQARRPALPACPLRLGAALEPFALYRCR